MLNRRRALFLALGDFSVQVKLWMGHLRLFDYSLDDDPAQAGQLSL
jgi:hypothetical protein